MIFFPKALKLPSPLHNLKFYPKGFDNPPPQRVGNEELYTPLLHTWIVKGEKDLERSLQIQECTDAQRACVQKRFKDPIHYF